MRAARSVVKPSNTDAAAAAAHQPMKGDASPPCSPKLAEAPAHWMRAALSCVIPLLMGEMNVRADGQKVV